MNRAPRILIRSLLFAGAFIYSSKQLVFTCPDDTWGDFLAQSAGGVMALWPPTYAISLLGRLGRETPKMRSVRWHVCSMVLLIFLVEFGRQQVAMDPCPHIGYHHLGPHSSLNGIDCSNLCLKGVNLQGSELRKADFSGANLSSANLRSAQLDHADFTGADLSRADLHGAVLSGADLHGANLSRADLNGACLSGADLTGADLSGADIHTRFSWGAFSLSGVNIDSINCIPIVGVPKVLPEGYVLERDRFGPSIHAYLIVKR